MSMEFEMRTLDEGVALVARLRGALRLNLVDRDILERGDDDENGSAARHGAPSRVRSLIGL